MDRVSKPLLFLLLGTVVFFALWMTMLKPSSDDTASGSAGLGKYNAAVTAARQAVTRSNAGNAASGQVNTASSTSGAGSPVSAAGAAPAAATHAGSAGTEAGKHASVLGSRSAGQRRGSVERALAQRKVVALLFFNPAGADDRAVRQELAAVPGSGGSVFKLAVPISELSRYDIVTRQVSVTGAPTLVLVDHNRTASTIVGFADRFEISQRVADALAT